MHYEILLVDDEVGVTAALRRALRGDFSAVYEAHSGSDALRLMNEHPIDVVISDYCMPLMNGGELLCEIHKRHPKVLKLMLSGQAPMNGFAAALNEGAISKFVCKPWDNEELRRYVRQALEEYEASSMVDRVTGIPTLNVLLEKIKHLGNDEVSGACVVLLDIVNFEGVNKGYGSRIGSAVLRCVAERIMSVAPHEIVARVIDDKFAVVMQDESCISRNAAAIFRAVAAPMRIEGHEISISCRVGITSLRDWKVNFEANLSRNLLQMRALYSNDQQVVFCNPENHDGLLINVSLISDLQKAIARHDLSILYQPQVDLKTLKVTGCEALLRWNHPVLGRIAPSELIPVIERYDMVNDFTEMLLNMTLSFVASAPETFSRVTMSINLYASQLGDAGLANLILSKLEMYDVAPDRLELEVTETSRIANYADAKKQLSLLRESGVKVAIDDFGVGYSTYDRLYELPVDSIKIDGRFIKNLPNNKDNIVALTSIIAVAKSLDLNVVAECVEGQGQVDELIRIGCDKVQGFLFSEALDEESFVVFAGLYNGVKIRA